MAATRMKVRVENTARRIRLVLGGAVVADTTAAKLVWEGAVPWYAIPRGDVVEGVLVDEDHTEDHPGLGRAHYFTVVSGDTRVEHAAWSYPEPEVAAYEGLVRFDWEAMDAWFEEDEQVFVQPRDPYHRVDVIASSRHVRVEVDGVTVAETERPVLLFETRLPTRYYLPKLDVRMDLLTRTDTGSACPYKGDASYWSVQVNGVVHEDLAWGYETPIAASSRIANHIAFFDEKVDVHVDGELQPRPRTFWSTHDVEEAVGGGRRAD